MFLLAIAKRRNLRMTDHNNRSEGIPMSHQLPELPIPFMELHADIVPAVYQAWADQMRSYAELAIASVKREPLSDGYILDLIDDHRQRHNGEKLMKFARAIEQAHGITANGIKRTIAENPLVAATTASREEQ
jgi:hypothetical protein